MKNKSAGDFESIIERIPDPVYELDQEVEERFIRTQGIAREITARKRAEEKLRRSEERYRNLVEQQGEGICVVNAEEQITFANPAAERIFGVSSGELTGKHPEQFLQPEYLLVTSILNFEEKNS